MKPLYKLLSTHAPIGSQPCSSRIRANVSANRASHQGLFGSSRPVLCVLSHVLTAYSSLITAVQSFAMCVKAADKEVEFNVYHAKQAPRVLAVSLGYKAVTVYIALSVSNLSPPQAYIVCDVLLCAMVSQMADTCTILLRYLHGYVCK